jgi:hypothetical protein
MVSGFRVTESFCESEVNDVNIMLFFSDTNQKVVWFDVSVKEMSAVHELNSLQLKFYVEN